ncbi:ABC transporter ATP-binding protein [Paractinoplanes atraurantiacus]|uniref:ABC-type multidrug transport system, ATPase and permease component n=1 Tax=Paractinoplanes atraurantiacus TaxID=1036182 RepID=A0A285KK26_9ACTN|nr:ABC transporter ATP-binding protein [Actinoplanes atraurantiacus]SNY72994.1 ABC-type multidrug transport system, ATPase and permease component [Actinoplanes atraurantiacus]
MADVRLLTEEPDQRHVLRRVWPHLREHRRAMAGAIAVNLLSTLSLTLVPLMIGRAVDELLDGDRTGLLVTAGIVLGLVIARTVLLRWSELLLTRVGEKVVHSLRDLVVERLGTTSLRFLEAHRGGDLLQRATVEIAELATFVRSQLPDLISLGGYLVFSVIVLLSSSWQLFGLLVLVFGPPMWFISKRFRRAAAGAYPAEAAAQATLAATFSESLLAREQLQIDGATGTWLGRLRGDADAYLKTARTAQRGATWIDATWIVQGLTSAALLIAGGYLATEGVVTIGVVVTFVLASRDLFSSIDDFTLVAGEMLESRVGLARLLDLLEVTASPLTPLNAEKSGSAGAVEGVGGAVEGVGSGRAVEKSAASDRAAESGAVDGSGASAGVRVAGGGLRAEAVTYGYRPGEPVLHGVSVHFKAGEHAGIVGETGSGKTTLAKLLCGLYLPDAGAVRLGDADLSGLGAGEVRRRLVLIPQQVHMIAGSFADNLALTPGRPGPEDFARAAERLGLGGWVAGLPGGFDAELGRRGERFSAGERQLVGLLRAAMTEPEVLILDEATADLDPGTAHRIEEALARLRRNRTVLVIAHRPSTIDRLPRVVRLHAGRITSLED